MEFTAFTALSGALVWAGLAGLAGLRRAPLGVIDLLLLFAVLVVVPLGLGLTRLRDRTGMMAKLAMAFQPLAALGVVVAFWHRPGVVAAACSVPWLVLGIGVAMAGAGNLYRSAKPSLPDLAIVLAGVDFAFAGGGLVVSRAGWYAMGFHEPIVLLTSVHFHYSGFAVAVLAGAAIRLGERRGLSVRLLRGIVWLVLFLPFLLAAGFVISPVLRLLAALGLALSLPVFAGCLFWLGRYLDQAVARIYVRLGAVAAWTAMGLAGAYAVTDCVARPFLTLPGMASTHGVLNGVGFVLCSTLAFWIEENAIEPATRAEVSLRRVVGGIARKRPIDVASHVPEFVAREFYDR